MLCEEERELFLKLLVCYSTDLKLKVKRSYFDMRFASFNWQQRETNSLTRG